jgi:CHAT domain-containing protein
MRKNSTSHANPDLIQACRSLVETAESFVNRAPRQKRIESERSALFDALSHAQLVLSVVRLPQRIDKGVSKREKQQEETSGLEGQLKQSQADLAKSRHALEQLDWLMQPVATTLDQLRDSNQKAHVVLKTALKAPARVLPFRKSR